MARWVAAGVAAAFAAVVLALIFAAPADPATPPGFYEARVLEPAASFVAGEHPSAPGPATRPDLEA